MSAAELMKSQCVRRPCRSCLCNLHVMHGCPSNLVLAFSAFRARFLKFKKKSFPFFRDTMKFVHKTTLGVYPMWSLYIGGLYTQVQ